MAVQVKQLLLDSIVNYASNLIYKAIITVGDIEKEYDFLKTKIDNGKIVKYVHMNNDIGTITNARLIDTQRRTLLFNDMNVKKTDDGFMLVFTINITVNGGVVK